jgi:hypothetical protein
MRRLESCARLGDIMGAVRMKIVTYGGRAIGSGVRKEFLRGMIDESENNVRVIYFFTLPCARNLRLLLSPVSFRVSSNKGLDTTAPATRRSPLHQDPTQWSLIMGILSRNRT